MKFLFLHFIVWVHLSLTVLLLIQPETQIAITASVYPLRYLAAGSPTILMLWYLITSALVEISILLKCEERRTEKKIYFFGVGSALLQQFLVTTSAAGCIVASINGIYLDGTVVSSGHIIGDQNIYISVALWHSLAIIFIYLVPLLKLIWKQTPW